LNEKPLEKNRWREGRKLFCPQRQSSNHPYLIGKGKYKEDTILEEA
jgi:hypothetical protein